MHYTFELEDKVRDYECDLQGIVNNANYQHYFEHARHEFLLAHGVSFAQLHEEGCDAVVARVELAYKTSLRPGDEYLNKLCVKQEGVKYVFHQAIFRKSDMKLCVKGKVESVAVVNGKLSTHPALDALAQLV